MSSESLAEFEREATRFLVTNLPGASIDRPASSRSVALFEHTEPEELMASVSAARCWAQTRFEAGFGWVDGPVELGGRGLDSAHAARYRELENRHQAPDTSPLTVGLGMVAPTILVHASAATKREILPAIHRGDLVACQLFSEPSAGSDLASLGMEAERDGDTWVLTGQKVWTSMAQVADVGEILCRTRRDGPPHGGITAFLIDLSAPGVSVRPLRQMTGGASFNEVFFDGVRVHDRYRLGEVNDGWSVARTTLTHERSAVASGLLSTGPGISSIWQVIEMVAVEDRRDSVLRSELADLYLRWTLQHLLTERLSNTAGPDGPGSAFALAKLGLTGTYRRASEVLGRILGAGLVAEGGDADEYRWADFVLGVPGYRIAGGTDEILKNIIGERLLGLPREPR